MIKRSFRKAQAELSLQQIIGLVIAVGIVLATLALFIGLMNIFIKPPSSGTAASVQTVADIVQALYDPANKNDSCYIYNFFIEENWAIAGFNADGVHSKTADIDCEAGDECIEERCCNGNCNNVIKPPVCGKGPCVCVCNVCTASVGGACTGSLGGKDCLKKGSVCRPFDENIGFKTFRRVSQSYCTRAGAKQWGSLVGSVRGLFGGSKKNDYKFKDCDLVYEGETCKGSSKHGVMYGAGFRKGDDGTLYFEILDTPEERDEYKVNCRKMMKDLKKKKRAPEKLNEEKPETDITQALDKTPTIKKK